MKAIKFLKLLSLAGVVAFASSCAKKEEVRSSSQQSTASVKKSEIKSTLKNLAKTLKNTGDGIKKAYEAGSVTFTSTKNGGVTYTTNSEPFTYQNAPKGVTFTSSAGIKYSKKEAAFVVADQNAVAVGEGGSVSIGDDNFDIDLAVCFSASSEGGEYDGLSPFDGAFSQVSGAMGIGGLAALIESAESQAQASKSEADFSELFKDVIIVQYIVFAKEASGEYKVTNFIDANEDSEDLESVAIGMAYKLGTGEIYFTNSGDMSISGATISFNGEYLYLGDFLNFGDDNDDFNEELTSVSGSGRLSCQQ